MDSVPPNPFTYLREIFKDTAFRASQYKILNKLVYAKKLLKICDLVETDTCDRCNMNIEDYKHLLWDCRYSIFTLDDRVTFGINFPTVCHYMFHFFSQ